MIYIYMKVKVKDIINSFEGFIKKNLLKRTAIIK